MDYTLAEYRSPEYEKMGFDMIKNYLVEIGESSLLFSLSKNSLAKKKQHCGTIRIAESRFIFWICTVDASRSGLLRIRNQSDLLILLDLDLHPEPAYVDQARSSYVLCTQSVTVINLA